MPVIEIEPVSLLAFAGAELFKARIREMAAQCDTRRKFNRAMENEILPWLRKQKGFLGVITLAVPGGREVLAISFWDQKENAQAYHSTGYPQVLKILGKLIEGTPHVRTFDVVSATLEKVAPRLAA